MSSIDRFLKLAKKTNSKFIVHDSITKEDFVILPLDEYEDLVDQEKIVNNILEVKEKLEEVPSSSFFDEEEIESRIDSLDEEVEKVNEDIALWYADKELEDDNSFIKEELKEVKTEKPKFTEPTDWHSAASVLARRLDNSREIRYDEITEEANDSLESIDINGTKLSINNEKEKGEPVFYEEPV
ncbi:MAG: hypothetical protein CO137_00625 [Candidatus Magasanikbacteria bacterium CG_4_9_14_3_um_filter_32_9]|uniref:Uncharacterized protein n=1 Tax=Candidatus Magasanikbacteria bacterium CG_4_9_14_3_um_filter_32_9 TaxID=1974644 RepID=A0A2M7Z7I7_9BACT|nr:MAG: hypothetical protein CO137_00625 [Candidatus Magasanikbacteria bacterium CG_4_9_14_3_um_filter_32_9]